MSEQARKKVVLISVGGSCAPIIYSLNSQKPDYIIYFASPASRPVIRAEIEPYLSFKPLDHDIIVTPDEQNLIASVSALMNKIPELLNVWQLGFGLDNSDLDLEKLPAELRSKVATESIAQTENKIQLPLHRSFSLLADLKDSTGLAYLENEAELRKVLSVRNGSLLAHGFDPVSEETYQKLLQIALDFSGISKGDLLVFPKFNWEGNL